MCIFFFQAEDGIRDYDVTGVQTCALPIYTGKAMAGLIGLVRGGFLKAGETVVFLHTGGVAAMFAYGDLLGDL